MKDPEIDALSTICAALQSLPDDESRDRVLNYAAGRFNLKQPVLKPSSAPATPTAPSSTPLASGATAAIPANTSSLHPANNELVGIAKLTSTGDLKITARDLKASSKVDAGVRLAHIILLANEILKGEQQTSSPGVLVPILKQWRLYDGNTRHRLAAEKGIIREGDLLSLDHHARAMAEKYIAEILDPEISGKWNPGATSTKSKKGSSPKRT